MKYKFNIGDFIKIKDDCEITFRNIEKNITYKVLGTHGNMVQLHFPTGDLYNITSYHLSYFELDKEHNRENKLNTLLYGLK